MRRWSGLSPISAFIATTPKLKCSKSLRLDSSVECVVRRGSALAFARVVRGPNDRGDQGNEMIDPVIRLDAVSARALRRSPIVTFVERRKRVRRENLQVQRTNDLKRVQLRRTVWRKAFRSPNKELSRRSSS